MTSDDEPELPADTATIATRAANEGVPIGAIGRIIQQPFAVVTQALHTALSLGQIGGMPRADWPPTAKVADRIPTVPRSLNMDDVQFAIHKLFRLTNLEAGLMMVLLRHERADKGTLHNVVEQQRLSRMTRPDKNEATDPKIVDVLICKMRKKLKDKDPTVLIMTSWGNGYYFEPVVKKHIFELIGAANASHTLAE